MNRLLLGAILAVALTGSAYAYAESQDELAMCRADIEKKNTEYRSLEGDFQYVMDKLNAKRAEIELLTRNSTAAKVLELAAEKADLTSRLDAQEQQNADLKTQNNELDMQRQLLQASVDEIHKFHSGELGIWVDRVNGLNEQVDGLTEEIDILNNQYLDVFGYKVKFDIDGGRIVDKSYHVDGNLGSRFEVKTDSVHDGTLTVDIPRAVLDSTNSRCDGRDIPFGIEIDFGPTDTSHPSVDNRHNRILMIDIPDGAKHIQIYGSCALQG